MILDAIALLVLLETFGLARGSSKSSPGTYFSSSLGASNLNGVPPNHTLTPSGSPPPIANRESDPCIVEPYASLTPTNQAFPPFDQPRANIYRYRQQQSVNLGSWFVHENWMTPSLFTCASGKKISELDIASGWGSTTSARAVLELHWDTFINQSDFEYLAAIGINTVRLPIGYWSLGPEYCRDTPFGPFATVYQNSWSKIIDAINMAAQYGIGVLIDLHGAIGSQNGQPHSGISDGSTGLFGDPSNMEKTINALVFLMQQLAAVTNVVGIQILNEPRNVPDLSDFYTRAILSMRQTSPAAASFPLYLHNGFDLERFTDYVANRKDFVVQDDHSYFVFTPSDEAKPASQHTSDIRTTTRDALARASTKQHGNLVVDEWSCALTPESIAHESDKSQSRKDFCAAQLDVYTNTTAGWSFWSYKKEDCIDDPGWCFKAAVANSLPSTFYSYGQVPTTDPWQIELLSNAIANMTVPTVTAILAKRQGNDGTVASPLSARQHVSPSNFYATMPSLRHRFEAIQLRRCWRRDVPDGSELTAVQRSTTKGYSDGFLTAKTFATYGWSKLGFIEQYISDSLIQLGSSVIEPGTESNYHDWFIRGLQDGQEIVMSILNP